MSDELAAAKRQMRRAISERRGRVPRDVAVAAERAVAERVVTEQRVRSAARVALYAALPDELPTRALFDRLGELGVVRLLPRIRGGELEFAAVESWDDLRRGFFDVLEPPDDLPPLALAARDVAIVPGVAFDSRGNRLGRGKGYYDRALSGSAGSRPQLIGAGYAFQVVASVPHDSRDQPMDAIVTEASLSWVARET
jgi:5-formyltetrahydrofolate cyclo-ligase